MKAILQQMVDGMSVAEKEELVSELKAAIADELAAGPARGDINRANSLHSRLRDFLRPFHGVATRWLQSYLDWFCWRERLRCEDGDRREVLYAHEAAGRYKSTRRDFVWTPYLDWWWWARQRSTVV